MTKTNKKRKSKKERDENIEDEQIRKGKWRINRRKDRK
jgi:hypothetical protein